MSDIVLLYLFTRLNDISAFFTLATVGGVLLAIFFGAVCPAWVNDFNQGNEEMKGRARWWSKFCLIVAFVSAPMSLAIPTKADMAIIVGGKIALDASRSDTAKEIGQEVLDAIRAQLKKAKE